MPQEGLDMKNNDKSESLKFIPAYKGHEFDALKLQFETQTLLLRTLTDIDLRIFTGYITVQLLLGGWLSRYSPQNLWLKMGIFVIDLTLTGIAYWLLNNNYMRRKEAATTVGNLNEALGFMEPGIYIQGKAVNAPTSFRPWVYGYRIGLLAGVIGIMFILFPSP